tara:strand:+ start:380 stop:1693 length:1314 start_codon:yes stop_codon:yes gene_type:complete
MTSRSLKLKERIFILAIENHKNNNFDVAKSLYNKIIKIDPNHEKAHNNLGVIYQSLGNSKKAKKYFEKVIEINPNYDDAQFNLGVIFQILGKQQKAKNCFEKAIEVNPTHAGAHNSLGNIFKILGKHQKAKSCFEKAIEVNPTHVGAHNSLGNTLDILGEYQNAKRCFEKAIEINPNYTPAYWNLFILSSNIDEALVFLKKLNIINNKHPETKIMIGTLQAYKGDFNYFNDLLTSEDSNHSYIRSAKWIFSLPKLPKIFFNRWDFYDAIISLSESSRPFYEFGVWNGVSFKYLINTFKKGFGFDTFCGLPESWGNIKKSTYSSFGSIPNIKGGEFIVGKFEDTLPKFFAKERPLASLINFDADLYTSTLCALNHSNKTIDHKTILIFDEFIMNKRWEEDEYKALNDFCDNLGFKYEVLAVSFVSKQVAIKLIKISSQ